MYTNNQDILDDYGIETIQEYYDIIIESCINGQKKQMIEQFNNLPYDCRSDFLYYLGDNFTSATAFNIMFKLLTI